jgi:hypothetical protein
MYAMLPLEIINIIAQRLISAGIDAASPTPTDPTDGST